MKNSMFLNVWVKVDRLQEYAKDLSEINIKKVTENNYFL